jgi:hypothetical protein
LIDTGLAGSSVDLEIRFLDGFSPPGRRLRTLDVEVLILVNQLETKISLLNPYTRAVLRCFGEMVFTVRAVDFLWMMF